MERHAFRRAARIVVSPVLSNIYRDRLDTFAETVLIPEYTQGEARARNPAYRQAESAIRRARAHGDRAAVRELHQQLRSLPSMDPRDPDYRRLRYARYADDALLGFTGPKAEAEEIRTRLAQFLRDDLKAGTEPGEDPDHARPHVPGITISVRG
jgi:hypothetical protein